MDAKNRALCFFYRNPPNGSKPLAYSKIAEKVKGKDGNPVTEGAVRYVVKTFNDKMAKRGRKEGWRKTTKADDKVIHTTFLKKRPPGHGVDSRMIHQALPKKLSKKISRRTIIRRLAEKDYTAQKKVNKTDPGPALAKRRVAFAKKNQRTRAQWNQYLQAVGDVKEFTYYPRDLRPKFKQLRASWTYMRPDEKYKPAFVRPKRWFKGNDYKRVQKQKVFGLTTSNGKSLAILLPKPFTKEKWAQLVKTRVSPFLKKAFPSRKQFRVLLDGEQVLRADNVKVVMREKGIVLLENWPPHSPDLNPQENVWPIAENILRAKEKDTDSFETFQKHCARAVEDYEKNDGAMLLVGSMATRLKRVVDMNGAMGSQ